MGETYKVKVYCTNCNFQGETDIPKGRPVSDHPCLNCGTKSLKKMQEMRASSSKRERYI